MTADPTLPPRRRRALARAPGRARPRRGRVPVGGAIRQPLAVGQPDAGPDGLAERRRLGRRRPRPRRPPTSPRRLRGDRGPGPTIRGPRSEEAGRPGRPRRRRHQEAHRRRVPQGQPAGPRRRQRAAAQGPWAPAAGREPRATSTSSCSASQVAGLYSPDDKKLYVVSRSGELGPTEKTTFAHEYTHALQDQNFDLGSLEARRDRTRATGRSPGLSLVEGDATLSMSLWQTSTSARPSSLQLLSESLNDPASRQLSTRCRRSSARRCSSRTRPASSFVQALQASGGWDGGQRRLRQAAGLDRADPPPREVRGHEAPVDGRRCRRTSRRGSATAGRSTSRTRSASSSCGSGSRRRGRSRRPPRTRRRPAGAATGSRSLDGPDGARASSSRRAGTRPRTPRSSRRPRNRSSVAQLGRRGASSGADGTERGPSSLATRRPDVLASLLGLAARLRADAGPTSTRGRRSRAGPSAFASVVLAAATSASRSADRSGSSGSTTRASR